MNDFSPIAIVGMSGVFPEALTLEDFWRNIISRKDACADIPEDRWNMRQEDVISATPAPDKAFHRRGCVVRNFRFDPGGFRVPADALKSLDTVHHLALHAAKELMAPFRASGLKPDRVGIILAAIALPTAAASYPAQEVLEKSFENALFRKSSAPSAGIDRSHGLAAQMTAFPAEIVAEALGLGGMAFTLDAACASSIYAVKLACDALKARRCDAVLAGGVCCPDRLYTQIGFSQLRALSPSGRCAPFDAGGDGLIVGEGAGLLLLRRLDDALASGDTVLGVIRGIGLSNDMRGNLLAPDTEGQVRAMQAAYHAAGWRPSDVDLIECHGAGTPVGDATELLSLKALWDSGKTPGPDNPSADGVCPIGSVKSMIGHLLTAAGAAGIIKTLLAMRRHTLPPSLNFQSPPKNSPLNNGPFRVQTHPDPWRRRAGGVPRRAGVSAFGFGGINAHILLEEWIGEDASAGGANGASGRIPDWSPDHTPDRTNAGALSGPVISDCSENAGKTADIAVVGMDVCLGSLDTLQAFQEAVLSGISDIRKRPRLRWRGCEAVAASLGLPDLPGGYMESITLELTALHIPPQEIPDILIQHLLMLKVAGRAMRDAGLTAREPRPRMGAIIGMGFDMEATDFHLRWDIGRLHASWLRRAGISLSPSDRDRWRKSLQNAFCPALSPSRTLGALAGVIASRVAREFGMGAPSFTVSGGAVSGFHALDAAVCLLRHHDADAMLIGAVDMACDVRNLLTAHGVKPFSRSGAARPFDAAADGTLPGEGAAALVLKRKRQAIADGDRIYAVIKGAGFAAPSGGDPKTAYRQSFRRSLDAAGASPDAISLMEGHGSGDPDEDRSELQALSAVFRASSAHTAARVAIGSVKSVTGHTGAAAGMVSLVKACLCLYQEIIPPLVGFQTPAALTPPSFRTESGENSGGGHPDIMLAPALYFPVSPHYWVRNRQDGPRRACCAAMTATGACGHVVLEGCDNRPETDVVRRERRAPTVNPPAALFVIEGGDPASLLDGLQRFETDARRDDSSLTTLAALWLHRNPPANEKPCAVGIVAENRLQIPALIEDARCAVTSGTYRRIVGRSGVAYSPRPLGASGDIAFVFPGSGNHFVGMGRSIGIWWPEVLRRMDIQTPDLKTRLVPEMYMPYRRFWGPGWEIEAQNAIAASPLFPIFGQVAYGDIMTRVMRTLRLAPQAVIGYSLGETAGYFALNAWPDPGLMLSRLSESSLFRTDLAGPCLSARTAWKIPAEAPFVWKVAVVNRPAALVGEILPKFPLARLLIINTPDECVIGGNQATVAGVIAALSCEAVYLDGVVTVHCDAAAPVQDAYRKLHRFPAVQPPGIRFYSCAEGRAISIDTDSMAASITSQAVHGFDFTATIRRAYEDGVRVFLEMGPHASCTRMIGRILGDRPHVAVSASSRGEDEYVSILKLLTTLTVERIPADLTSLCPCPPPVAEASPENRTIIRKTGGPPFRPRFPEIPVSGRAGLPGAALTEAPPPVAPHPPAESESAPLVIYPPDVMQNVARNAQADAEAHQAFLSFSDTLTRSFGDGFALQAALLEQKLSQPPDPEVTSVRSAAEALPAADVSRTPEIGEAPAVAYSRAKCFEFATGSVAGVLGPEFAVVDTYPARVRLPDVPLMLVDRILSVEGRKGSLGPGQIVTEHDVLPDAWYLDGGHAPVCISVEAGQADLFLCAWLGIDLQVKGRRTYRLLDAVVQFHKGLPSPGDTIRYEIRIDRFVRQSGTWLFFFSFRGYIGRELLITMTNGCAGFFTAEEVENSGGIILTDAECRPLSGKTPAGWKPPAPMTGAESYGDVQVAALRTGNLSACFGAYFDGIHLSESLRLPGGRMRLIDRILRLEPSGGRYGLGMIRGQADIHPDDWFLTCHFMDDPVMPGTLMYECCAHTLRVFIQRLGWVSETPGVCYEPVPGGQSILKCRGPVTPHTRQVVYTIEIRELGYMPEPFVIADALMTADGRDIVLFRGISMKMTGVTRPEIESFWKTRLSDNSPETGLKPDPEKDPEKSAPPTPDTAQGSPAPCMSREQILSFCSGKPSNAFGNAYRPFDSGRFVARLPRPPYLFMDRVTQAEPPAFVLKPGGWITAEYDVPPSAWYFAADGTGIMPFAVLLEIALQPCGWLAAYAGSALSSPKDLHFRNLGGTGMIHGDVFPDTGTLTMRCRMTQASSAADMIIESFDFQVMSKNRMIYDGHTTFGFFTPEALKQQKGLSGAKGWNPATRSAGAVTSFRLPDLPPFTPDDVSANPDSCFRGLAMPAGALRMMDAVKAYIPDGGPHGLGWIRGEKIVRPDEWFFHAHFYQDPVWPGSLGIEALMQLVRCIAVNRWPERIPDHRFSLVTGTEHAWTYRGQVIPENHRVAVEAAVIQQKTAPSPLLIADGFLSVDGLTIYEMNRFGFRILPH